MHAVIPLHWITALYLLAAGLVYLLPPESRVACWSILVLSYLCLAAWGSVRLGSGVLGRCVTHGPQGNAVALTYDDGPDPAATPRLLDLLAERGVQVSFFVVGEQVEQHPELVRRMHAEGHLLGNHSHTHTPWLAFRTSGGLHRDLDRCQAAIERVTGERPRYFRPPYGVRTHATQAASRRSGLQVIGWSAGGGDGGRCDVDAVVRRIAEHLQPGSIVLLHDRGPDPERTAEITRRVLDAVAQQGLRAVRLDELLTGS